jgi:hypothetical protein
MPGCLLGRQAMRKRLPTFLRTRCWSRKSRHIEVHGSKSGLFDHLVGASEQRRRHFEAERLGAGQIDDEIEFGRLLALDRI